MRAQSISDKLDTMESKEEKIAYMEYLEAEGVFPDEVYDQVNTIQKNK